MEAHQVSSLIFAPARASDGPTAPARQAEMLFELGVGLQNRARAADQLRLAISLYERAAAMCPSAMGLLKARILVHKASALRALPGDGFVALQWARDAYESGLAVLRQMPGTEELAEAELGFGSVLQALAAGGLAKISDAISAYRRALKIFEARRFPQQFALLQANLESAYRFRRAGPLRAAHS